MRGLDIKDVLNEIKGDMKTVKAMVAHNLEFSMKILVSEFIRNEIESNVMDIGKICTMRSGTNICQLESSGEGFKFPKLKELHQRLFDADPKEDLEGCKNCFMRLKQLYNY
jgi:DNA polymerase III alpha subunit (gram-positive type)